MKHTDGRLPDDLRPIIFTPHFSKWAQGIAEQVFINIPVLCNGMLEEMFYQPPTEAVTRSCCRRHPGITRIQNKIAAAL